MKTENKNWVADWYNIKIADDGETKHSLRSRVAPHVLLKMSMYLQATGMDERDAGNLIAKWVSEGLEIVKMEAKDEIAFLLREKDMEEKNDGKN